MVPPTMAATAIRPTTTPTAMPTLLVPPLLFDDAADEPEAAADCVTTIVAPPLVTTDGVADVVPEPELDAELLSVVLGAVGTLAVRPVR